MDFQQTQYNCARCGRPTLHTRTVSEVPHVLYLLLSLLCCCVFVPIWMVHVILHTLAAGEPFRCTVCGQQAGQLTAEQLAVIEQRKADERQETRARRAKLRRDLRAWLQHHLTILWAQAKQAPGQIDRLIGLIAGEGNDILYRFLQVFIYVALPLGLLLILVYALFF